MWEHIGNFRERSCILFLSSIHRNIKTFDPQNQDPLKPLLLSDKYPQKVPLFLPPLLACNMLTLCACTWPSVFWRWDLFAFFFPLIFPCIFFWFSPQYPFFLYIYFCTLGLQLQAILSEFFHCSAVVFHFGIFFAHTHTHSIFCRFSRFVFSGMSEPSGQTMASRHWQASMAAGRKGCAVVVGAWHLPEGVKCLNLVSGEGMLLEASFFSTFVSTFNCSYTGLLFFESLDHQLNLLRFIVMAFGTHPDSYAAVYFFYFRYYSS